MAQVSKHQLHPEMVKLITAELSGFMSKITDIGDMRDFLSDFLTSSEQIMLSKRFMIMVLLMRGHSVEHIKNTLYVSNSAVMSVSSWLKNASESTKKSLHRLNIEKNWETFFDNIETILDKLPPGKYQNWQRIGQEKNKNYKSRQEKNRIK